MQHKRGRRSDIVSAGEGHRLRIASKAYLRTLDSLPDLTRGPLKPALIQSSLQARIPAPHARDGVANFPACLPDSRVRSPSLPMYFLLISATS